MAGRKNPCRGVVDTSVLVAGIVGFKPFATLGHNPSAKLLRDWIENRIFVWLVTEDILNEYKEVLGRLGVRRNVIGALVNQLREEAEFVEIRSPRSLSPDPADDPFCACAESGQAAFIVTLNPKDFPQKDLSARVILPGEPIPTTARRAKR